MVGLKLLLVGASGYIGGAVLTRFLKSPLPEIKALSISALVRKKEQAELISSLGVNCILFNDLDETDLLERAASEHDIVIHCGQSHHHSSGAALIAGLGERKKYTTSQPFYIRTTGTSSLADRPVSKRIIERREFSDKEDVYEYEQYRESLDPYLQRSVDLATIATGEAAGIRTYTVMPPLIYGRGDGPVNQISIQIPSIARAAIKRGYASYVGDGTSEWDHVHVLDLAMLYEALVARILSGYDVPSGRKGIFFSQSGRHSWLEVAQGVARAGVQLGVLKSEAPRNTSLDEAAQEWTMGSVDMAELGFGSRSTTKSDRGRELGWEPQRADADWEQNFLEDFEAVLAAQRR